MKHRSRSAPLMQFTRPPKMQWHKQPPPVSGITWCGLCRRAPLRLFDVPDDVWLHYLGPDQRHQVVCIQCWRRLTEVVDGGAYQAEHGGPLPLWSDQWRARHGIAPDEPCPMTEATLRRFTIAAQKARTTGDVMNGHRRCKQSPAERVATPKYGQKRRLKRHLQSSAF